MGCSGSGGGKVGKVSKIASSERSAATSICNTTWISDPDNNWVAHRQAAITAAMEKRGAPVVGGVGRDYPVANQKDERSGQQPLTTERQLSGESERIGQGNWDEAPIGKRVGYL